MSQGKKKQSVLSRFILAVLLVVLLYAILSVTVYIFASRYQLNTVAGADIQVVSSNSEKLTRGYINGTYTKEVFLNTISEVDESWVGTITIWDGNQNLIYGEDSLKAFIGEGDNLKNSEAPIQLSYSQTNLIYIRNEDQLQAIIQVTDHTLTTKYIEAVFNKALFFSLIIIFSLISILVFFAHYFSEFTDIVFQLVCGKEHQYAD